MSAVQRWIVTAAAVVFLVLVAGGVVAYVLGQRENARVRHQQEQELTQKQTECHDRANERAGSNARFRLPPQYPTVDALASHYFDLCMVGELPP